MSASLDLSGMGVALVTPFNADLSVDFTALGRLMDYQIESGADYILVLGTTAETPTLTQAEREQIRRFAVERVAGRVPLVLGIGGNCTRNVIEEIGTTDLSGYSAILSVVPFYNKPTQAGIHAHYAAIAEASPLPIVLYNVPGRTGVNMTAETTIALAREFPQIIAVKEASGNISQVSAIIRAKVPGFQVLSGDDGLAYTLISLGATGVISVLGNAYPTEFTKMVHLILEHKMTDALAIHHRFSEMFNLLFADGNPAGVKSVLSEMGMIENVLRLPLVPAGEAVHHRIAEAVKSFRN